MPPRVKSGNADRYWREVQSLSRLRIAVLKDESIDEKTRQSVLASTDALNELLVDLAKRAAA